MLGYGGRGEQLDRGQKAFLQYTDWNTVYYRLN